MPEKKAWTAAREEGDALIISFPGEGHLDEADATDIHNEIMSEIDARDAKKVVIDFGNVNFISSAFLGTLVAVNRTMQARDGALVIASIRPEIYQLLQVTNLHRFFAFSDDIQSALESL